MKRTALALSALILGCGASQDTTGFGPDAETEAGADSADPDVVADRLEPSACADAGDLPTDLDCTGLYTDLPSKQIAAKARPYAPATPLWSDGAEKHRWIQLPDGATIDRSNPSEWVFPLGTKVWKEFRVQGKRVETRFFTKVRSDRWVHATYAWNDDESAATLSYGGDIQVAGKPYHLPIPSECDSCHKGRTDRILGFEEVSLGTKGATGLTLGSLVDEARLVPPPPRTNLVIGDDGTGAAAPALAWLHINCGVTCHNSNSNATAYATGQRLRIDPTKLDGSSSLEWDSRKTTLNIDAITPRWHGQKRIVPGFPDKSLLSHLIGARGTDQMPPIASLVVDTADVAVVAAWISAMPHEAVPEAGVDAADGAIATDGAVAADASGDESTADASDAAVASEPSDASSDASDDVSSSPADAGAPDVSFDASVDGGPGDQVDAADETQPIPGDEVGDAGAPDDASDESSLDGAAPPSNSPDD